MKGPVAVGTAMGFWIQWKPVTSLLSSDLQLPQQSAVWRAVR